MPFSAQRPQLNPSLVTNSRNDNPALVGAQKVLGAGGSLQRPWEALAPSRAFPQPQGALGCAQACPVFEPASLCLSSSHEYLSRGKHGQHASPPFTEFINKAFVKPDLGTDEGEGMNVFHVLNHKDCWKRC